MATGSRYENQSDLLRIVYEDKLRTLFNLKSILLQRIGRNTRNLSQGEHISVPLHVGVSGGFGYSNTGVLPAAGYQRVDRATFNYKNSYGRVELDGPFMDRAAAGYAADTRPIDLEMKKLVKQIRHAYNFDLYQDGSGKLAAISSVSSGTVITPDSLKGFTDGIRIDILQTADGNVGSGVAGATVTVNRSAGTITLSTSVVNATDLNTNKANYTIYRAGSRNAAPFGLAAIVNTANPSTANYGNIDRTASGVDWWKGNMTDKSGGQLLFRDMAAMCDQVDIYSDGEVNLIITDHNSWNLVTDALRVDRRYGGQQTTLNGWAEAVLFNGIPIVKDKHCPSGYMYFLSIPSFTIYQYSEGGWMDMDGAILARVPGMDAYEACWIRRWQVVCDAPNANGVIYNYSTSLAVG